MPDCEFREGQFEQSFLLDLERTASMLGVHFRPSGGLEKHLGFDLALRLGDVNLQRFLARRRQWPGAAVNALFQGSLPVGSVYVLPVETVNLFLQMKVPYRVSRQHRSTLKQWQRWGAPYFRINLEDEQQQRLTVLEQRLGSSALVRYATPCFFQWTELAVRDRARAVVAFTHVQSPSRLGAHRTYTYQDPVGKGVGFSDPEEFRTTSLSQDLANALDKATVEPLVMSFARVWAAVGRGERSDGSPRLLEVHKRASRELLGIAGEVPLDQFGLLSDWDGMGDFLPKGSASTLSMFIAAVFALEEYVEQRLGLTWRVVVR